MPLPAPTSVRLLWTSFTYTNGSGHAMWITFWPFGQGTAFQHATP